MCEEVVKAIGTYITIYNIHIIHICNMYFNMYYMYVDTLSPHPHPTLTTNHNNYLTLGPPTHSINTARLRHRHWTIYLICNHAALWLVG